MWNKRKTNLARIFHFPNVDLLVWVAFLRSQSLLLTRSFSPQGSLSLTRSMDVTALSCLTKLHLFSSGTKQVGLRVNCRSLLRSLVWPKARCKLLSFADQSIPKAQASMNGCILQKFSNNGLLCSFSRQNGVCVSQEILEFIRDEVQRF